jgi:C4-dicarboxylate-specific signal transduction histidine kinase
VADGAVLAKHLDHVRTIIATQQRYAVGRMHAERVALASLIDDAIAINLAGIERHGISLERDYAAAPMWHGEPHRLLQILINLIANAKVAVSGLGNKKTIRITARLDSDGIRIQVADNGQGMDAATMARLFSFGFTTRPDGHGFGLHSCQQHATALGGTLTAASDGPGCGAAFTLHLPTTT